LRGDLKALYVFGENIVQTGPDSGHVRAPLGVCDLVISQEIFLSQTAFTADVVLPGATYLEKDGSFVNSDRRFQRVRPSLQPPGDARTDSDVIHAVAGASTQQPGLLMSQHPSTNGAPRNHLRPA